MYIHSYRLNTLSWSLLWWILSLFQKHGMWGVNIPRTVDHAHMFERSFTPKATKPSQCDYCHIFGRKKRTQNPEEPPDRHGETM